MRSQPGFFDGAPQPASFPVDADGDLVEIPDIARRRRFSMEAPRMVGAVFSTPAADCLVGNGNPTLEHHLFDLAQAHIESEIKPDSTGDNIDRKAVVPVGRQRAAHATGYRNTIDEKST